DTPAEERDAGDQEAEPEDETQRHLGEAQEAVQREVDHAAQRVLGLAGETLGAHESHLGLTEPDPGEHAADESVLLAQRPESVESLAIDEAIVAGVGGDRDARQAAQDPVVQGGGGPLEPALAAPLLTDGGDDLVPLAPLGRQL